MDCSQCSVYKNVALSVPCDCRVCPAQPGIVMCGICISLCERCVVCANEMC